MAGEIALSQALVYAGDFKALFEASKAREKDLAMTCRRLRAAHQQALRYALDLKHVYGGLQQAVVQSLSSLANALEAKDPYTRGHSERVGWMACRVARACDMSWPETTVVAQAGFLHDLGKIGVGGAILGKAGPLTDAEWEVMRRHPVIGAQILSPLDFFAEVAVIVRHHHERLDGSGYPDGLAGEAIPLGARIVAVADVYDALTSERPYRSRVRVGEALALLEEQAARTLDGRLVRILVSLVANGHSDPRV